MAALVAFSSSVSVAEVQFGPPAETRSITRTIDPVVVPGDRLSHFIWAVIDRVGLFAYRNGKLDPIPFQIDEKDADGLVLPGRMVQGTGRGKDEEPGKIDQTDEVVFLAKDTGDRLPAAATHPAAKPRKKIEIEVIDPVTQGKGWVYAFEFPAGTPVSKSAESYVKCDPKGDYIRTPFYEVGFEREDTPTAYTYFAIPKGAGGNGTNLVDTFKANAEISLFFGTVSFHRDLKNVSTTELGYREGPVRIVRRIASSVEIALRMQSPEVISDSYFYPNFFEFPGVLKLPFDAPSLINEFKMVGLTDFSSNAVGMTWINSANLQGVAVDGIMSEAEKNLDKRPYDWVLVHGKQGAWMNMLVFHGELAKVVRNLYYVDDRNVIQTPEREPGSIGATGYDFSHLEDLGKGNHHFTSYIFSPTNYSPGGEQIYVNYVQQPLVSKVK